MIAARPRPPRTWSRAAGVALAGSVLVTALVGAAHAGTRDMPPVELRPADDPTRLRPEPGALGVVAAELEVAPEDVDPWARKDDGYIVAAHLRYATLPDFVLDLFLDDHTGLHTVAAGFSVAIPLRSRERLVVELDWTRFTFPSGNWRGPNEAPGEAEFVEADFQQVSVDVTWRRFAWVADWFAFIYGAGGGLAVVAGEARTAEVLPSCEEPIASCPHWRQVGKDRVGPPSRILPVVHALVGVHMEPTETLSLRLEVGFRNVFYAGLAAGWRI